MRNVIGIVLGLAITLWAGCSDKSPSVRVSNQRTTKANVQFKQANGNTINHNDVAPGASSNFQDVAEGQIVVTAVIQNETVSPTTAFNAMKDHNYTVVITNGDPPELRVDTQNK
jgi:hypothetical protein